MVITDLTLLTLTLPDKMCCLNCHIANPVASGHNKLSWSMGINIVSVTDYMLWCMVTINFRNIWIHITSLLHLKSCGLGAQQTVVVVELLLCKRAVNDMVLECRKVLSTKFHSKFWAAKGCQMFFRWSSDLQRNT